MTQKLGTPLEQAVVGPHIRHANPHPQYALAADVGTIPLPATTTPASETVGDPGSTGTTVAYARSNHVHPMPGLATASAPGFMAAADKTRIDAIGAHPVISPLDGALLDIDAGQLVWDVATYEQVMA